MRRGGAVGSTIKELKEKLKGVEKSKNEYSSYLKKLQNNYYKGKISYARYVEILYQKREGRNINEWINHLDKYETDYNKEIRKQKRKSAIKNTAVVFLSLAVIVFLFSLLSNSKFSFGSFTGFVIGGNVSEIVQSPQILGASLVWIEIVANTSNPAYNGTLNEITLGINKSSPMIAGVYPQITSHDNVVFNPPGFSTTFDVFVFANFTIPSNYINITVTTWSNQSSTTSSTIGLALWNFSSTASNKWVSVASRASTTVANLNYTITNFANFVSNNQVRVMAYESSGSSRSFGVDYIGVNVSLLSGDSTPPDVTIINPEARNYHIHTETPMTFNVSLSENGTVMYSLNNGKNNFSMSSKDGLNFNATNSSMGVGDYTFTVYANDTLNNKNYSESVNFSVIQENILINGTVTNSNGTAINSTITIYNENEGTYIYNETGFAQEALVPLNATYTVEVIPNDIASIDKVEFNNVNFSNEGGLNVSLVNIDEVTGVGNYSAVFSIDPQLQNFSNLTVFFTATSDGLHICSNWSYSEERCLTKWAPFMRNLQTGEVYNFTIEPDGYDSVAYGIIKITAALHLDSNKTVLSDIFPEVSALDDIWSENIPAGDYVRVTFAKNLTNKNDISLVPRNVSGTPIIEVYEIDRSNKLAEFNPLIDNQLNKIYLTNLLGSQDRFDLKVVGGTIQIDYIVDPSLAKTYYLWAPSSSLRNFNISLPPAQRIANMSVMIFNSTSNPAGINKSFNWTMGPLPYTSTLNLSNSTLLVATIYCNRSYQTTQTNNLVANISSVIWLDCGTSSTCAPATAVTICTNNSIPAPINSDINGNCNSTTFTAINVTCKLASNYTMHYGDYLGLGISIRAVNTSFSILYNSSTTPTRFNLTEADDMPPVINVLSPTPGGNYSYKNISFNVSLNEYGSYCNFSLDSNIGRNMGKFNNTLFNYTNTSTLDGNHNISFDCNDTFNNWNTTSVITFFTVDTLGPAINITYPTNNTNYSNNNLDINFSVNDAGIGRGYCWYSNDSYKSNSTPDATCANVTTMVWADNQMHNFTIWANDTIGNLNWSTISFKTDATPPIITVINPINGANYTNHDVSFNVSLDQAGSFCNFSLDSNVGVTMIAKNATWFNYLNTTTAEGMHNISFDCNDTLNNWNTTSVLTWFRVDSIAPNIAITYPSNNTNTSNTQLNVNYTVSDSGIGISSCWYSNSSGLVNYSLGATCINITGRTWLAGINNVTVYTNDSANNVNSSFVSFFVDNVNPGISITYPTNNTNTSNTQLNVNYTVSDNNGISTCWYTNDSAKSNYSLTGCANITGVTWLTGINNITVYVNDTVGNTNSSFVSFFVDTTNPQISITYPTNRTNSTNNLLNVNYTFSDNRGITNCWYSNDSYSKNTSLGTSCTNITGITWTENIMHNVTVWVNDSAGNLNWSEVSFGIDTIFPNLAITYPTNNTNTSNTQLNVNYTVSDIHLASCWYTNDSGISNYTLASCVNITGKTWLSGINNITVYANDTFGNTNSSFVSFFVDTTNPQISITYPTNNTNTSNTQLNVNYTVNDNRGISSCWYTNDSAKSNYSLGTSCTNITGRTWLSGINNVTVYVNDSANNVNSSFVSFFVDNVNPNIAITYPTNNTNTSNTQLNVNYTVSDTRGISTCWYTNDSAKSNYSLGTSCTNITGRTWLSGINNVTIYVNDSVDNENSSFVSFFVDNVNPNIAITYPANNTNTTNTQINVNYTVSDNNGISTCWYTNDSAKSNHTLTGCANITGATWLSGINNVTVYINDSVNNVNSSFVSFFVDNVNPKINITFPLNNTVSTNTNLNINYTVSDAGVGIGYCWYSNDSYSVNSTPDASCANITGATWDIGQHNVTVWVNDTLDNENSSRVTFNITTAGDSVFPQISITYPPNSSNFSTNTVNVNYTASDNVAISSCWYSNDSYDVNISLGASCANITTIVWNNNIMHNVTVWVNDTSNNVNWSEVSFNVTTTVANTPPIVTSIFNSTLTPNLNPGPQSTSYIINFTAYDADGNLNYSTAKINLSLSNEITRENSSCEKYQSSTNYANFSCNITMFWYDGAGNWNITASILDNATNFAMNGSNFLLIAATTAFTISQPNMTWSPLSPGQTNITATNNPILINNTGNQPIGQTTGNVTISATNLFGESDASKALYVGNFSVSTNTGGGSCSGASCTECSSTPSLVNATYVNITNAFLPKGNYTVNDGTAQEQLYFCIKKVGTDITPQAYSTQRTGVWIIKLLVVILPAVKKSKSKKKEKETKENKLIESLDLLEYLHIVDKLKEEYNFSKEDVIKTIIEKANKKYGIKREEFLAMIKAREGLMIPMNIFSKEIGGLEAMSKYMKENLGMTYSEIAKEIGRNERTIWTSYKKAKEKQKESFSDDKKGILIPISIFNNSQTILESIILYLKEKEMKYSEIAKLLNRDQRNIRTIYIRMVNKNKRNI